MCKERARETCFEMLVQRGYKIIDTKNITALKPDGTQMIVFFNESPSFDTKSMKEIFSVMTDNSVMHSIVIYKDKVTPATKSTLEQSEDMKIELFAEEDLQFNITKHRLQPKFEKLKDSEAVDFKKNFGIKFGILRLDRPIARFYNYQKGDVIRITRNDGYINYRIVKG
jgi:DNA-directed RNA polymerase I, II, and III subunit RPABC1